MFTHKYNDIISIENILDTWKHFVKGKRKRLDVADFESNLAENIVKIHESLSGRSYEHSQYSAFNISDPKPRNIHKAIVLDRAVHHLIYKELYPYFESKFIYDSYSCRDDKGTHRALDRLRVFANKSSENNTKTCYVLKCDIKKFFASIDHNILRTILKRHIECEGILWLTDEVVKSFHTTNIGVGLPLGNLTSQLFVNIYMHEFDMYVKQELKQKYYIRYADDFVFFSQNKSELEALLKKIDIFLREKLKLTLHENKVYIKTYATGVDFLGWVHFPYHRQIRSTTKRKLVKNLKHYPKPETISSYRGLLSHGDTYEMQKSLGLADNF